MTHGFTFALMTLAIGIPLMLLRRRGLFGAKTAFLDIEKEFSRQGRVVLRPSTLGRFARAANLTIDSEGLTIGTQQYLWRNITKPFVLREGSRESKIIFYHREPNFRYGKRSIFRNTKDEFLNTPKEVRSAYSLGWSNLLTLLNSARERELKMGLPD